MRGVSYSNLYFYTRKYLKQHKDVRLLVISCNPFEQLFFGYLLKKEFPDLKWIADYRDDWTSNQLYDTGSFTYSLLKVFNRHFEKKWVSNADGVLTVSQVYADRLSALHGRKVEVVMNGFRDDVEQLKKLDVAKDSNHFMVSYSGTIYENQELSVFLSGLNNFVLKHNTLKVVLQFIGAKGFQLNNKDLKNVDAKYAFDLKLTERLPWKEAYLELLKSDALFLTSYSDLKGIPTSKLFEYITTEVPIILAPTDQDIMEEIIKDTNTGYICNNSEEVLGSLDRIKVNSSSLQADLLRINSFSAAHQTVRLVKILQEV